MRKKPTIRKRSRTPNSFQREATGRRFYQCTECGGLVNGILVNGDDSWCPHCKKPTFICSDDGHIPEPSMYGQWLLRQAERATVAAATSPREASGSMGSTAPEPSPSPIPLVPNLTYGESTMKQARTHTGIYSCLDCYTEFELTAEKSLCCECGGLLVKGTLEELGVDDDDTADEKE